MSKTIHMNIQGMHCKGCALGLQGALESLPQVISAQAAYPEQTAVVVWDDDAEYENALRDAVARAGFTVESFA